MKFVLALVAMAFVPNILVQSFQPDELRMIGSAYTMQTYNNYVRECYNRGWVPVSVHNVMEANAVWDFCVGRGNSHCWIGLHRSGNTWAWEDGTPFDYAAWDRNEPGGSEYPVVVSHYGNWGGECWHDWGNGNDAQMLGICREVPTASSSMSSTNTASASKTSTASRTSARSTTPSKTTSKTPSMTSSTSKTPSMTSSTSKTPSSSQTPANSPAVSESVSYTPGVCNEYCVGVFGYCQQPTYEDFSCYPFDGMGNCPTGTISCPDVVPENTMASCNTCIAGTTGPCQHGDGTCHGFVEGTGVCPVGLTFCGSQYYSLAATETNHTSTWTKSSNVLAP